MLPKVQYSAVLPIQTTAAEAAALARAAWRKPLGVDKPVLSYYPLMGAVFTLRAAGGRGGAAKFLDGRRYQMVIDRCSATPLVTRWNDDELLDEISAPQGANDVHRLAPEGLHLRATQTQAVRIARRALVSVITKQLKLGAQFDLDCVETIWPLWKPNWLFEAATVRVLVCGLSGNVVFRR